MAEADVGHPLSTPEMKDQLLPAEKSAATATVFQLHDWKEFCPYDTQAHLLSQEFQVPSSEASCGHHIRQTS